MHLTLTPQQGLPGQPEMTIHVVGDVITIDGTPYDLGAVPEGGEGWPEDETPFRGAIQRFDGVIHATIAFRLGQTSASIQDGPWIINDASGDVAIPAKRNQQELTR